MAALFISLQICCLRKPLRVLKKKHNMNKGIRATENNPQFTTKNLQDDLMKGEKKTFQWRV